MLTPQENERLTRVGPGTPMGDVFRRYWLPAALSSELPDPGGAPVRVRLLGEDLIAFRATDGTAGFIESYPAHEAGGIVWAYLGPEEAPPPPGYELLRVPATHRFVSKTHEECNYLQALEGGLDTAHSSFLHNMKLGDRSFLRNADTAPRLEVEKTGYGFRYAGIRTAGDQHYVRVYHYVMPATQLRAFVSGWTGHNETPSIHGHFWVPIDDVQTNVYNFIYSFYPEIPLPIEYAISRETSSGRGPDDLIPGTFRLKKNLSNDYMIDRNVQKTQTFTGIAGINTQDFALQEGMGPIVDRSKEHLGTTDRAIIVERQLLMEATHDVAKGNAPRGSDGRTYAHVRPVDRLIAQDARWQDALKEELVAKY
jgi:phthalate 4,5-dioxygenase